MDLRPFEKLLVTITSISNQDIYKMSDKDINDIGRAACALILPTIAKYRRAFIDMYSDSTNLTGAYIEVTWEQLENFALSRGIWRYDATKDMIQLKYSLITLQKIKMEKVTVIKQLPMPIFEEILENF